MKDLTGWALFIALAGFVSGVVFTVSADNNNVNEQIKAGVFVQDGKVYRITPADIRP